MDIKKLIEALNKTEKDHLFVLLMQECIQVTDKTLLTWIQNNQNNMSIRLYNILNSNIKFYYDNILVSELTKEIFQANRNAGDKSWEEFVSLRGY